MDQDCRLCIEPRKMYSCGHCDNLVKREKADVFEQTEGNSPECDMASVQGHHRGLRPGHVLKGVSRELGRSESFLM